MDETGAQRHICFCGVTVIGASVCSACAQVMVDALLRASQARAAQSADTSSEAIPAAVAI